ncbi:MAG: hypothetical protein J5718_05295 [Lachnospiraceae bacterium]|nr:hypothetical protein [Lachnospiraceae bacterium]
MNEIKEIHMEDKLLSFKDNLVKTNVLPQSASELRRDIRIQGNVTIEGSVYGHSIEIDNGPVTFEKAVYTDSELHVKGSAQEKIIFRKAVASADSITAFVADGKVIFGSDVNAVHISLKNCYVGGSVFGTDVTLENCVVLGGVFATKKLTMNTVCVGTFYSPEVNMGGINELLYPTAFSVEPLACLPGTEIYNLAMADLGALFKGDPEGSETGKITMDVEHDTQRTVLVDDNGTNILINSYSVAGRVLASDLSNIDKLENHFLIGAGSLSNQLLKTYSLVKENNERSEELTLENIADFFFKIVSGVIQIQEISGSISFEELKRKLE